MADNALHKFGKTEFRNNNNGYLERDVIKRILVHCLGTYTTIKHEVQLNIGEE